jgi:integrase/recombinase XerD
MRDLANLPSLLQSFFTTRLMTQRKASPHTIASYRDTFRLLLQFAQKRLRRAPSQLMPLWSTRFWKIWKTAGAMAPEAGTCV